MAIFVHCAYPKELLVAFKKMVESGDQPWTMDEVGNSEPTGWGGKAVLRAEVGDKILNFYYYERKRLPVVREQYILYHTRLCELLLRLDFKGVDHLSITNRIDESELW